MRDGLITPERACVKLHIFPSKMQIVGAPGLGVHDKTRKALEEAKF
jgi:hypothetical protein